MKEYERAVDRIMAYLNENHYGHTLVTANRTCFDSFKTHLVTKDAAYSSEAADDWLGSIKDSLSSQQHGFYRCALARLRDIYESGKIQPERDTRHLVSYTALNDNLRNELDGFLKELGTKFSPRTVDNYKHTCARFLIFVQKRGISLISDISYDQICCFFQEDIHHGRWGKHQVNGNVSTMMAYFYHQGEVPYGFTVIFHYLALGKGCYWNDVSDTVHKRITEIMASTDTVSVDKLLEYKETLNKLHSDNGYSKTVRTLNNRAVELLALFLDMNRYRYNPDIAMAWFDGCSHHFNKEAISIRRALCLAACCHRSFEIRPETVFRIKPRAFELIPEWSRDAARRYVDAKTREGWAVSTLNMIRSSICRFCHGLDQTGVRSFMEVTASHIKQFHIHDIHKTAAGKNAYNARIRKFLAFLGENGYLMNPMLFTALPCTNAPKETIVVTLTEPEMAQLNEKLQKEASRLSLRDKAMLLLGLKMGLRSSDIVRLKFDDINWDTASIRFIQEKTKVEADLPMPTEVGNAIFRYITQERQKKTAPAIFLSEKAPYKPIGRAACTHALDTALPIRKVEGSGFHVTRKTYATNLIRNGVGAAAVADALGQCGVSSVHRYLSLDADRIRMCALTLEDCGIGGWENGR